MMDKCGNPIREGIYFSSSPGHFDFDKEPFAGLYLYIVRKGWLPHGEPGFVCQRIDTDDSEMRKMQQLEHNFGGSYALEGKDLVPLGDLKKFTSIWRKKVEYLEKWLEQTGEEGK